MTPRNYWTIAGGLLVGLGLAIWGGVVGEFSTDDPVVAIPLLAAFLYAAVSAFVVALEIRDRFGFLAAALAFIVTPVLVVYWFSRINSVDVRRSTVDE